MSPPREHAAPQPAARSWRDWLKLTLTLAFFGLVVYFLAHYAHQVKWRDVWSAIQATSWPVLAGAAAFTVASFALYSSFDLLGRHYTGHDLPVPTCMKVNFISYAFNLNIGSMIGAVAFRFRLYSQLGLATATIARVLTLSMITNWLGYLVLAGVAFAASPLELPPKWGLDSATLRVLGLALLAGAAIYVALCLWSPKRSFTFFGHELLLPPRRMVPLQLAMGCTNWMLMAGIIDVLLPEPLPYLAVLNVLLVAALAGVITHVPAGLGVLEAVFLALLSHRAPSSQLLAALLTYRALYYIAPMLVATVMYLLFEARVRRRGTAS